MKLSASMEKALNEQYVKELYSAYLYLSMSKDMKREGFTGYASWLKVQHDEELEHAFKISDYIEDREGVTEFGAIEEFISDSIRSLFKQARAEGDLETEVFLQWYITEQVEEEANAHEIVDGFKATEDDKAAFFSFDQSLKGRKE